MKKVLMVIGAMAYAIGVQAASIDWSVTANSWTLSNGTSKAPAATTVYLIDGSQWDTIKSAIDGGATAFTANDAGILAVGATTSTKGYVAQTTATKDSLVAGTVYDFAYLVFDNGQYFASATKSVAAYDPMNKEGFAEISKVMFDANQYSNSGLSGGWATATPSGPGGSEGIPEPTSGLLLLVGASLLALRRKQK